MENTITNSGNSLRKLRNWLVKYAGIIALPIAVVSLYVHYMQYKISERLTLSHIEPEIECLFDLPQDENPVVLISNKGDIPVMSLSVAHCIYEYDKETTRIVHIVRGQRYFRDDLIFRESLGPNEYEYQELVRVDTDPVDRFVIIYLFNLKYYSGKDMREHSDQKIFFVDSNKAYDHLKFRKNKNYSKVIREIERVQIPEVEFAPGKLKELLQAWDKKKDLQEE